MVSVFRRHWIYLWPRVALYLLFAVVPVIALWLLLDAAGASGNTSTPFGIVAGVYFVYWLVRIYLNWYRYQNDIWVITTQRLIDSFRTNPFNLRVATADLVNVQDMTVQRIGVLQTALDFGDVICQTASDHQDFRLTGLPKPRDVQALVDKERDRERLGPSSRHESWSTSAETPAADL